MTAAWLLTTQTFPVAVVPMCRLETAQTVVGVVPMAIVSTLLQLLALLLLLLLLLLLMPLLLLLLLLLLELHPALLLFRLQLLMEHARRTLLLTGIPLLSELTPATTTKARSGKTTAQAFLLATVAGSAIAIDALLLVKPAPSNPTARPLLLPHILTLLQENVTKPAATPLFPHFMATVASLASLLLLVGLNARPVPPVAYMVAKEKAQARLAPADPIATETQHAAPVATLHA